MIRPQTVEGFLLPCIVLKSRTQDDCYVVNIVSTEEIALLPKSLAQKQYKVGDTLWALVHSIEGWKVTLTQKGEAYVEAVLKGVFSFSKTITVRDVAYVANTKFYKVAVSHKDTEDPGQIIYDAIKYSRDYIKYHILETVTFVPWFADLEQYIIHSLRPGRPEDIERIVLWPDENKADVYVNPLVKGVFLGPNGLNAAASAKLTGVQIRIL